MDIICSGLNAIAFLLVYQASVSLIRASGIRAVESFDRACYP